MLDLSAFHIQAPGLISQLGEAETENSNFVITVFACCWKVCGIRMLSFLLYTQHREPQAFCKYLLFAANLLSYFNYSKANRESRAFDIICFMCLLLWCPVVKAGEWHSLLQNKQLRWVIESSAGYESYKWGLIKRKC